MSSGIGVPAPPTPHNEHMFDTHWPDGDPLNKITPTRVPNGSTGTYPVIARLVWPDREEGWPAKAIRWTDTAVLVAIQIEPDNPLATRHVWLRADDVMRKLTVRTDGSSMGTE